MMRESCGQVSCRPVQTFACSPSCPRGSPLSLLPCLDSRIELGRAFTDKSRKRTLMRSCGTHGVLSVS
jgi:hypothetical protein